MTLCCVLLVQPIVSIEGNEYSALEERELEKDRLLYTLPNLAKEWKVSFEVNPSSYEEGFRSILRLYRSNVGTTPGVSCLSIGIYSSSSKDCSGAQCSIIPQSLTYRFISNGTKKSFQDKDLIPQLNEWTKIEVTQVLDGNSYKIVFNDGAKTKPILNPQIFEKVKVYAADWNGEQKGKIRNLRITYLNTGQCKMPSLKHILKNVTSLA